MPSYAEQVYRGWARDAARQIGATGASANMKRRQDAYLKDLGHKMKWTKPKGQPAYRGRCTQCRGICWVIDQDGRGNGVIAYVGDLHRRITRGARRCG